MKLIKKVLCLLMCAAVCFSLAACTGGGDADGDDETQTTQPITSPAIEASDMKIGVLYYDKAIGGTASLYQKQGISAAAQSLELDEETQMLSAVGITDVSFDETASFNGQSETLESKTDSVESETATEKSDEKTTKKETTSAEKDSQTKKTATEKTTAAKKATALETVTDFISAGCNVIIATDTAYENLTLYLAQQLEDIFFLQYGSTVSELPNLQYYGDKLYEGYYLAGAVAGTLTKSQKIGFVYGKDTGDAKHNIYAFNKGVSETNEKAQVLISRTGVIYDLSLETTKTNELIKGKCDVVAQFLRTALPQMACEKAKVNCMGSYYDMSPDAENYNVLSVVYDWSVYFKLVFGQLKDGFFAGGAYLGGVDDGLVGVTELRVDSVDAGNALNAAKEKLTSGFDPLDGYSEEAEIFSSFVTL